MAFKILLADDSMTAQNLAKKILTDVGYEVIAVSNGAAAMKKISTDQPDLLILDVYMPGYTGLEVCEKVKSTPATAATPVLLTVAPMEPFNPAEGTRVKADGVILKPFEARDLLLAVEKFEQQNKAANGKKKIAPSAPSQSEANKSSETRSGDIDEELATLALKAGLVKAAPIVELPREIASAPAFSMSDFETGPQTQTVSTHVAVGEEHAVSGQTAVAIAPAIAEGTEFEIGSGIAELSVPAELGTLSDSNVLSELSMLSEEEPGAADLPDFSADSDFGEEAPKDLSLPGSLATIEEIIASDSRVSPSVASDSTASNNSESFTQVAPALHADAPAEAYPQDPAFMADRTEMIQFATHFSSDEALTDATQSADSAPEISSEMLAEEPLVSAELSPSEDLEAASEPLPNWAVEAETTSVPDELAQVETKHEISAEEAEPYSEPKEAVQNHFAESAEVIHDHIASRDAELVFMKEISDLPEPLPAEAPREFLEDAGSNFVSQSAEREAIFSPKSYIQTEATQNDRVEARFQEPASVQLDYQWIEEAVERVLDRLRPQIKSELMHEFEHLSGPRPGR